VEGGERRAGPEATPDLAERPQAFVTGEEVQGEQARGGVERAVGRIRGVPLVQDGTAGERPHPLAGEVEHRCRRVDADERPSFVPLGQVRELETAPGADDEHAAVVRNGLGEELLDDAVQNGQPRDRPARPLGVRRHRRGIGEGPSRHRPSLTTARRCRCARRGRFRRPGP
jgi:hypothetical protein